MHLFRSLSVGALLSAGCAAPLTEVAATRESGIGQDLFEEGEQVWITYQGIGIEKTGRGIVLESDEDSVRLDLGRSGIRDIRYRSIRTVRRPAGDRWYAGVSTVAFPVLVGRPQELPSMIRLTGAGVSIRRRTHQNGVEANLTMGGRGEGGYSSWIGLAGNAHFFTILPRSYVVLGTGRIWPRPMEAFNLYHNYRSGGSLTYVRIGFGVAGPVLKGWELRLEVESKGMQAILSGSEATGLEPELFGATLGMEYVLR